jgi:hypothetical protein
MRPTEKIEKFLQKASVNSNPDVNKTVLNELADEMEETKQADTGLSIWIIIIRSPITKFSAAAIVLLFLLFSVNLMIKRPYTKTDTSAQYILGNNQHVIMEIDTSPRYILFDARNNHLNRKEIMPCNILPVLPNQF